MAREEETVKEKEHRNIVNKENMKVGREEKKDMNKKTFMAASKNVSPFSIGL